MIKPTPRVREGLSEIRSDRQKDSPQGGKKEKQVEFNAKAESRSDRKYVALGKHKTPPSQTHPNLDLHETLNVNRIRTKIYIQNYVSG